MDPDTNIGGPQQRFPVTNHSAIVAAGSSDKEVRERGFEAILASYWKPAYKYIRIKWQANNEDAKDLTQNFFATAFEKNFFASYDVSKASFQTFLRTCLDRFIANEKKSQAREKRGGIAAHFPLDFADAEEEIVKQSAAAHISPEEYFHREWIRSLFTAAVETLRRRCVESGHALQFQLFEKYDLERDAADGKTSYRALAEEFGLEVTTVTNYLAAVRRDFRKTVLAELRQLTATQEEFQRAARELLGSDV